MSSRQKGPDEIFCRSCGERIKEEAEICPECGVRNQGATPSSPELPFSSPGLTSPTHDPDQYETTVTDAWWYGIAGGVGLWVMVLILAGLIGTSTAGGFLTGVLALIAWASLPVATFFDIQYVRANSQWNPTTVLWLVAMLVWLVNIVAGAVYLYRRHEVLGVP